MPSLRNQTLTGRQPTHRRSDEYFSEVPGRQIDVRTQKLKISGFGGTSSVEDELGAPEGAYGGFLLAAEWDRFALGGGWAHFPGSDLDNVPVAHLRIGREASHFRADAFAPSPTPSVMSALRIGYGFAGESAQGFVGLGAARAFDASGGNGGIFVDLAIPVRPTFDVTFKSSWHDSENHADWGAAVGAQIYLGR